MVAKLFMGCAMKPSSSVKLLLTAHGVAINSYELFFTSPKILQLMFDVSFVPSDRGQLMASWHSWLGVPPQLMQKWNVESA